MSRKAHPIGLRLSLAHVWKIPANLQNWTQSASTNLFMWRWLRGFCWTNFVYLYDILKLSENFSSIVIKILIFYDFLANTYKKSVFKVRVKKHNYFFRNRRFRSRKIGHLRKEYLQRWRGILLLKALRYRLLSLKHVSFKKMFRRFCVRLQVRFRPKLGSRFLTLYAMNGILLGKKKTRHSKFFVRKQKRKFAGVFLRLRRILLAFGGGPRGRGVLNRVVGRKVLTVRSKPSRREVWSRGKTLPQKVRSRLRATVTGGKAIHSRFSLMRFQNYLSGSIYEMLPGKLFTVLTGNLGTLLAVKTARKLAVRRQKRHQTASRQARLAASRFILKPSQLAYLRKQVFTIFLDLKKQFFFFFPVNCITVLYLAGIYESADTFLQWFTYYIRRIRKHSVVVTQTKMIDLFVACLTAFVHSAGIVSGYYLEIAGKVSGSTRTRRVRFSDGKSLARQRFALPVKYGYIGVPTYASILGVRLWLVY
jgi:hypothetical protein